MVRYAWLLTEEGLTQVFRLTSANIAAVSELLADRLVAYEGEGLRAVVMEVSLDLEEKQVVAPIVATYNTRPTARLKRRMAGQLSRFRVPREFLPAEPAPLLRNKKFARRGGSGRS